MVARPWLALVVFAALLSMGAAQHRTENFIVDAPTPIIAQRIGQWAEYYRKQKAIEWLGKEMPNWGRPCPLKVKVTYGGSGGATTFSFDNGRILTIEMEIEGTLDRLIASVLPHEVTHTVLAYNFRCPVPRWADEGGSVLSEDEQERTRHDQLVRQILRTPGRAIPLKRLFTLTKYPADVMVLYAEGYSVTNWLVGKSNRQAFLTFVGDGMRNGWDQAVRKHYSYQNVDELERAWLQHLRETQPGNGGEGATSATTVASVGAPRAVPMGTSTGLRQTLPPAMPIVGSPRPVFRGVAGDDDSPRGSNSSEQGPAPAPPRMPVVGAPRGVSGWD